jgi:hypothetical protein
MGFVIHWSPHIVVLLYRGRPHPIREVRGGKGQIIAGLSLTDPGSFKLTDISYRLRFSFVSFACIVRSFLHSLTLRICPFECFQWVYILIVFMNY